LRVQDAVQRDLDAIARISAVPTILRTIRAITGLRYTLIARVLPDRWIAAAVHDEIDFGLAAGGELDVNTTLCREVRDSLEPVIIDDVTGDTKYCGHPTPKLYGFQSYIAVPIFRQNGEYFGNICGLDPEPRRLTDGKTLATMRLFAELVSFQLDAEERHESGRQELLAQRTDGHLRDQFLAVLGHDVRNPLSSIVYGTELLLRRVADAADRKVLQRVRASAGRITSLVDELLDLARGRVGGGIALDDAPAADLAARMAHVVDEVQAAHPQRPILFDAELSAVVRCDAKRIEQLLSNLLANAVEHGTPGTPIAVEIRSDARAFRLRIENHAPTIPGETLRTLFQPYARGGQSGRSNGLGLGLYIVSEIAKAHGGTMDVESAADRTAFTFVMPCRGPATAATAATPTAATAATPTAAVPRLEAKRPEDPPMRGAGP
jgi:signal transduction histidine kinase